MGVDSGISESEASRIGAGPDGAVGDVGSRGPSADGFPRVDLDATDPRVRNHALPVTSMAVIVATGVTRTRERAVLGPDAGDSGDEISWTGIMTGPNHAVRPVCGW